MLAIKALDVFARSLRPIVDDVRSAATAATGLVHELVGEECAGGFVTLDDEFDPLAIRGLGFCVAKPRGVGAAKGIGICVNTAKIIEVVVQDKNKLDAVSFGGGNSIVEARNTLGVRLEI